MRSRQNGRFLPDPRTARLKHDIFAEDLPSSAWLAGLLAADGHISTNLKGLTIAQSGPGGRALIEEIRRLTNHRLAISVQQPARGRPSYSIHFSSAQMVSDLQQRFRITTRKSLTYEWPDPPGHLTTAFLRGYVDGDGCVGIYPTPQGNPMLHLSFAGTPHFIQGAMRTVPAHGLYRVIKRCKSLAEARYNGRHAWRAANWIFSDAALFRSEKARNVDRYRAVLETDPPAWHEWARQRAVAMSHLGAGETVAAAAEAAGVCEQTVYTWLARRRNGR
ncbi:hypothetical protein GCM10010168_06110 [Actinoplanes ianthinogenes]|uniref:Uncharacterized protein n=2 Tax=Actinoplanes ianthinogenes TaxID=122358 RepID=A0ABM7LTM1_9ACTN|nr:hypothetical protein Aiant_33040 [Actinoplanes ianthinogenes]GGQ93195.1 hypothetical protein GCM10010168_06110 [Actinoplanes ianthinogenes]